MSTQDTANPIPETASDPEIALRRFQCRHIFTDGHRCGSPCLRRKDFCFYHHNMHLPVTRKRCVTSTPEPPRKALTLPLPEDRSAIQHAIGQVVRALADETLDPRRAGLILYGLQIASHNLPRPLPTPGPTDSNTIVEEVALHPRLGALALRALLSAPARDKSLYDILMEQWDRDRAQSEATAQGIPLAAAE